MACLTEGCRTEVMAAGAGHPEAGEEEDHFTRRVAAVSNLNDLMSECSF